MSDVVIRGMEMPKTCCQCDLKIYDPEKRWDENGIERIGAWVCKRTREIIWNTQRGDNCPLVPLPEGHGDLIDRDNVLLDIDCTGTNKFGMLDEDIRAFLRRYKPIIPAEGRMDNGN